MYTQYPCSSLVTAIVPESRAANTINALNAANHDVMTWHARGSLKDTRWYKKLFPAIAPEKIVIRVIVTNEEVENVIRMVIHAAKLNRHATGAVYAVPMEKLEIGGLFHTSCEMRQSELDESAEIRENLDVIQCIVDKNKADNIARAAIDAGAHGPVVHYAIGKGLRDRLGWLRITKQQDKEVLTIISEKRRASKIFDAMASAGNVDMPGGGFMYQMPIEKGLFNLRSYHSSNHQIADLQQMVAAIDHLMGNDDWRAESIIDGDNDTCAAGLSFINPSMAIMDDEPKACLTMIVDREHLDVVTDLILNAGAKGLNVNFSQLHTADDKAINDQAKLVSEYGIIRTITSMSQAHEVMAKVRTEMQAQSIEDACLFMLPVSRLLTYVHHPRIERRRTADERNAA